MKWILRMVAASVWFGDVLPGQAVDPGRDQGGNGGSRVHTGLSSHTTNTVLGPLGCNVFSGGCAAGG